MLKGFPSWNVPLAHTLNYLPAQVHEDGQGKPAPVDSVLAVGSMALTASKDGSINLWNTRSVLQRLGRNDFKA